MRGHTDAFGKFGVVLVVLMLVAVPVAAQVSTVVADYEDGTLQNPSTNDDNRWSVNDTVAYEGTYSAYAAGDGPSVYTLAYSLPADNYTQYDVHWRTTSLDAGGNAGFDMVGGTTGFGMEIAPDGSILAGINGGTDTGDDIQADVWYRFAFENIDVGNGTFDIRVYYADNDTLVSETVGHSMNSAGGDAIDTVRFNDSPGNDVHVDFHGYGGITENGETVKTTLEMDIRQWMPFDSTQDYRVYLNETNTTTGDTNLTDVTADANVTVYNITNTTGFSEPIVTVNNTTDTLRSYNQTGQVAVNATWNGNEANATNVTVGNRNLSNIGIMPPSQWISSFFEIDEAAGGVGLGTPMQWVLFIVLIMAAAARMFDNPWAGLGGGMVTAILVWVLQFVALGVVLATVFSTIFVGLLVLRSRRMSVNVGGP